MKTLFKGSLARLFATHRSSGRPGRPAAVGHGGRGQGNRIAVPDLSAGTEHSGGGVVDVLRSRQIFEKGLCRPRHQGAVEFLQGRRAGDQ